MLKRKLDLALSASVSATNVKFAQDELTKAVKLQAATENDAITAVLDPPPTWESMQGHGSRRYDVPESSSEYTLVISSFLQTLDSSRITIVKVQRIQDMGRWRKYALFLQNIIDREQGRPANRFERAWLFHGTEESVIPSILASKFNRSYAGKNAVLYGKGVYFARDASYSSSTTYSIPNAQGVQHIFLCRVAVGEYCLGKNGQLEPDVRSGATRYDSTVNNMSNPSIFVAFDDAQAYPEYLVQFKQQ